MKALLFALIAGSSTVAFAQQDVSGCDLTSKPGYAICKMHDCMIGEATVKTCEVRFRVRGGSAGQQTLPKCDQGQQNYPCEIQGRVQSRPATTADQADALNRAHQREVDQYNKAGG
ncbi:MAG: hypothetical protein EOP06_31945 [Proteobacteria bacterium]|nr:MAG: hypothetical protein EOP06_31945 [Pseudomonadota bacterium]